MNENFVLDNDTFWWKDLSGVVEKKKKTTIYREREQVEALDIEVAETYKDKMKRLRVVHYTPGQKHSNTMVLEITSHDASKIQNVLDECLDRLNKE